MIKTQSLIVTEFLQKWKSSNQDTYIAVFHQHAKGEVGDESGYTIIFCCDISWNSTNWSKYGWMALIFFLVCLFYKGASPQQN